MLVCFEILKQVPRTAQRVKHSSNQVCQEVFALDVGWIKYRPSPSGTPIKRPMLGSSAFPHVKKRPCGSPPLDDAFKCFIFSDHQSYLQTHSVDFKV